MSDPSQYNGGAVVAMKGKRCVAIASDLRYGNQLTTISTDFSKAFELYPNLWVGLPGLATDTQTLSEKIKFRLAIYQLRENRVMKPEVLSSMLSNMMYERRFSPFFVEPVVAGLNRDTKEPFITAMDCIGNETKTHDFVVAGVADELLYGMCENLWKPNMAPDELFEVISQSLVNAVDRNAITGWGAIVHVVEPHRVTTKTIKTRMD